VPFQWTINPYRGCEFGCKYCYARYTHEFMELRGELDFETKIFAKQWNPRAFREELRRIDPRQWIAIGTATDPYQPAERRYGIMRRMLKVLVEEKGLRLSITTKSDLVARDVELLRAIAGANVLQVAVTITTMDEKLARMMEPYAPHPVLRMKAVSTLAQAGLRVGVLACPILPLLNDSETTLDEIAAAAAGAGAACFAGGVGFLKPCTHQVFFPFLEKMFPHLLRRYRERFRRSAFLKGAYPEKIAERLNSVRARHGLARRFPRYQPEHWQGDPQLELQFGETASPGRNFSAKSTCR
jgi:DNA repair photolyase